MQDDLIDVERVVRALAFLVSLPQDLRYQSCSRCSELACLQMRQPFLQEGLQMDLRTQQLQVYWQHHCHLQYARHADHDHDHDGCDHDRVALHPQRLE